MRVDRVRSILAALLGVLLLAGCSSSDASQPGTSQPPVTIPSSQPAAEVPAPSAPAVTAPRLKSSSIARTYKDSSEYACGAKVTVWERVPGSVSSPFAHPADAAAQLDPSTDYDPKTDVVIPVSVTLTNKTKGFDLKSPGFTWDVGGRLRDTKRLTEPHTLDYMGWYTDGWQTAAWKLTTQDTAFFVVPEGSLPQVEWSQALAPGEEVTHNGFFIYRDPRTPANPNGTAWALDEIVIKPIWTPVAATEFGGAYHPPYITLSGKVLKKPLARP